MEQLNYDKKENTTLVLLTGASGYLAGHILFQLLEKGYKVRGTVRSLKDHKKISHLYDIHPKGRSHLELVEADLISDLGWNKAMEGVEFVIHTASPLPRKEVKNEEEVIKPAVEGTERVFLAALKQNVKKIVITSSSTAVATGVKSNHFTELNWSNPLISPAYEKSKHLAEKKAWELFELNKDRIQMTVILPVYMQGPSFHSNDCLSSDFITKVLNNKIPAIPKVSLQIVDVRESAFAHIASIQPDKLSISNGQRYILSQGSYWMEDLTNILREEFEPFGYKIPSRTISSSCLFSLLGLFEPQVALLKPLFGRMILFDNSKSKKDLGVEYRYHRTTILEFAYDLIKKGAIPNKCPN